METQTLNLKNIPLSVPCHSFYSLETERVAGIKVKDAKLEAPLRLRGEPLNPKPHVCGLGLKGSTFLGFLCRKRALQPEAVKL